MLITKLWFTMCLKMLQATLFKKTLYFFFPLGQLAYITFIVLNVPNQRVNYKKDNFFPPVKNWASSHLSILYSIKIPITLWSRRKKLQSNKLLISPSLITWDLQKKQTKLTTYPHLLSFFLLLLACHIITEDIPRGILHLTLFDLRSRSTKRRQVLIISLAALLSCSHHVKQKKISSENKKYDVTTHSKSTEDTPRKKNNYNWKGWSNLTWSKQREKEYIYSWVVTHSN